MAPAARCRCSWSSVALVATVCLLAAPPAHAAGRQSATHLSSSSSSSTSSTTTTTPQTHHRHRAAVASCQARLARHSWPGAALHRVPCDREDVHCFVKQALRMWWDRKIPAVAVERAWKGTTDGEHCSLVQIINGRVYVHDPPAYVTAPEDDPNFEPWKRTLYRQRTGVYVDAIKAALATGPLPDTELTVCVGDCVSLFNPRLPHTLDDVDLDASFSVVQCLGSATIPLPLFDIYRPPNDVALSAWDAEVVAIKQNRDAYPWATRSASAVFRGGVRSCHACATPQGYHFDRRMVIDEPKNATKKPSRLPPCGRERAMQIAASAPPGLLDFDVLDHPDQATSRLVTMPGHEAYKYVAYLHGHCHWANRLRRLLFMGSAVLKQVGLCEEYYGMRLQPWVHYVPVDYTLANLTAAVEWARAHDGEVRRIVANMQAYADKFNTAEFAVQYTYELLKKYAELLDYTVVKRFGGRAV